MRTKIARLGRSLDVPVFVDTPDDTVIAKLEWSTMAPDSERQRQVVAGILETIGAQIDAACLDQWVRDLGLEDEWRVVRSTAST